MSVIGDEGIETALKERVVGVPRFIRNIIVKCDGVGSDVELGV